MKKAAPQYQQSSRAHGQYTTAPTPAPQVRATFEEMAALAYSLYSAPLKVRKEPAIGTSDAYAFLRAFDELREIVDHGTTGLKGAREGARWRYRIVQDQIARGELILGGGQ